MQKKCENLYLFSAGEEARQPETQVFKPAPPDRKPKTAGRNNTIPDSTILKNPYSPKTLYIIHYILKHYINRVTASRAHLYTTCIQVDKLCANVYFSE